MILAEATVVIDFLRTPTPRLLKIIQDNHAGICGVTLAEILAGAKAVSDFARYTAALSVFAGVAIPDAFWSALGRNLFTLRGSGITVPFADALIATVAIENDLALWTHATHFAMMQIVLPRLRLFVEPP
jgi:predicted nucleic acid-binding protein